MPRISRAYSSVFCPLGDVSHIWTPDIRKVLRFSNRRVVARFLQLVLSVLLVVVKSRGATPGAVQPELSSDHYVALWLVMIASMISLAFLLIRGLAKDLQDTILVLLRFWKKIRKEKKK